MKIDSKCISAVYDLLWDTGYWMTVDEFIRRGESSLQFFDEWGKNPDFEEHRNQLQPGFNYSIFNNTLLWLYPFDFMKERKILPSSVSASDQALLFSKKGRPTELMQMMTDFRNSALEEVLGAAKGQITPSSLRQKAFSFIRNAVDKPDLLHVIRMELDWYNSGTAKSLYMNLMLKSRTVYRNPGSPLLMSCFHEKSKNGGSLGICGTVAFLLFMADELELRSIHSIKQEALDSVKSLKSYSFHLDWENLEADEIVALDRLNRKAGELHRSIKHRMSEYFQDIREILFPDELVDIHIPCRVPRSQVREMKKELTEFLGQYKGTVSTNEERKEDDQILSIEKKGKMWCYRFKGDEFNVPVDKKGHEYIQQLVMNPDTPIPSLSLYSGYYQGAGFESNLGSNLDNEAVRDLKKELREIEDQIEISKDTGHYGSDELRADMERLEKEIRNNYYASGNPAVKKATQNVSNAIGRAIKDLEETDSAMGYYLHGAITKGAECIYKPEG